MAGIFIGAFLVNLSIGSSVVLAAGIAIGTLGPPLTAEWLKRAGFNLSFNRQRDVGLFILAACLGMALSATGGVANYLAGLLTSAPPACLVTWWMGDVWRVLVAHCSLPSAMLPIWKRHSRPQRNFGLVSGRRPRHLVCLPANLSRALNITAGLFDLNLCRDCLTTLWDNRCRTLWIVF